MFQIVRDGKVTYEGLAENIAKLAPTAKVAGVSLEHLGALLATVLKVEKPERAMTAITAALMHAAKAGKSLMQIIGEMKGKSLDDIVGAGISKRAAQGVALLASNFDLLQTEIGRFSDVTGRADAAFEKMNAVRGWSRLWQSFLGVVTKAASIIDAALAPAIERVTSALNKSAESGALKDFIDMLGGVAGLMASEQRMEAVKTMGEIITLHFVLGAQKATAILQEGIIKAVEKANDLLTTGVKKLPGFAARFTAGAAQGGPFKALFDAVRGGAAAAGRASVGVGAEGQADTKAQIALAQEQLVLLIDRHRLSAFVAALEEDAAHAAEDAVAPSKAIAAASERAAKARKDEARMYALIRREQEVMASIDAHRGDKERLAILKDQLATIKAQLVKYREVAALTVAEFAARQKQAADREGELQDEGERAGKLRAKRSKRGLTMSKQDAKWLAQFEAREKAKNDAVNLRHQAEMLEDDVQDAQAQLAQTAAESLAELKKIREQQDKLLQLA